MGGTQKKLTKGYTSDPRRWVGVNVKEKRVVKVVWKRKGLSGAIADFSTLTALTWLDLSYNSLTSIDAGIGSLPALTYLFLSNNKIAGTIPPELGNLSSLLLLSLHNNMFEGEVPSYLANLCQLENLSLRGNKLTPLPASFLNTQEKVQIYLASLMRGNGTTLDVCVVCIDAPGETRSQG